LLPAAVLTIIDRYMLRQFIQVLVICLMSMIGLYIVIDAFSHLDHFIDYAGKHGSLIKIMGEYYAYRGIAFFDRTSGVLTLIAVMFTITWIQRHNEMTALLAAGVSRTRVLRPVLIAAVCVSLAAAANREIVMPRIRDHLATDSRNIGGDQATNMQARFDSQTDILIGGDKVVAADSKIVNAAFVLPRQFDQFGKQLTAGEAKYMPADGDRPSGYWLYGVTSPKGLLKSPWLLQDNKPIIMTPVGCNWLEKDQVFVVSGVDFEFLSAGANWIDFASTREMIQQLRSPSLDLGADVRFAIHARFLAPILDTTLLFLGLPFVISRTNRNPFISLALCLVVVTVFMVVNLGCKQLGTSGLLATSFAAWLPLMLFAPLAAGASDTLQQ
jgi:lipopolysaccharide export system permease protein